MQLSVFLADKLCGATKLRVPGASLLCTCTPKTAFPHVELEEMRQAFLQKAGFEFVDFSHSFQNEKAFN